MPRHRTISDGTRGRGLYYMALLAILREYGPMPCNYDYHDAVPYKPGNNNATIGFLHYVELLRGPGPKDSGYVSTSRYVPTVVAYPRPARTGHEAQSSLLCLYGETYGKEFLAYAHESGWLDKKKAEKQEKK